MSYNSKLQSGAALLVSLVILLVLSIIGLSAMRGGLLQALISANSQQAEMAFSAADAGASAMMYTTNQEGTVNGTILANQTVNGVNGPATRFSVASTGVVAVAADPMPFFDDGRPTPITTVAVNLTYVACQNPGANTCVGYSMKAGSTGTGCHFFQMDSDGVVDNTSTQVQQWAEAPSTKCM